MTVGEWRKQAALRLRKAGDEDAVYDTRLLVAAAFDTELSQTAFLNGYEIEADTLSRLEKMLSRRESGEPLQYIEGKAYFMGLAFYVDNRVLIPRQDTETLCEAALDIIKDMRAPRVLDMCTGSGAIAVSIAKLHPGAVVTAVDISEDALEVAKRNAKANGVNVEFLQSDGFTRLSGCVYDLIVCNPPYLTLQDMNELQTEVRREPALALYGGDDGYGFYRRFAAEMRPCLENGGYALYEVGMGQAEEVARIMKNSEIIKDLCGVDRVVKVLNTVDIYG